MLHALCTQWKIEHISHTTKVRDLMINTHQHAINCWFLEKAILGATIHFLFSHSKLENDDLCLELVVFHAHKKTQPHLLN